MTVAVAQRQSTWLWPKGSPVRIRAATLFQFGNGFTAVVARAVRRFPPPAHSLFLLREKHNEVVQ